MFGSCFAYSVTYTTPTSVDPANWTPSVKAEFNPAMTALLTLNPDALRAPLERDFLHHLEYLRTHIRTPCSENVLQAVQWWEDLGRAVGTTEDGIQSAEMANRTATDVIGCGWLRCIRYSMTELTGSRSAVLVRRQGIAGRCARNGQSSLSSTRTILDTCGSDRPRIVQRLERGRS